MLYSDLFRNALTRINEKEKASDIQLIIQQAFHISKEQYWMKQNQTVKDISGLKRFYRYFKRLRDNEPVQYILKNAEFYGIDLYVKRGVLIPRGDTETLVDTALGLIRQGESVLDIGAGSGAISLAISSNSNCLVTALEKSDSALFVLKKNIKKHNLQKRVFARKGDLFPPSENKFHMVVSNPPYIPEGEWKELDPKVKNYEPKMALVGGEKGLEIIEAIINRGKNYLHPSGYLLLEVSYNQAKSAMVLLRAAGYRNVKSVKDLNGIERVVVGQK